MKPRSDEHIEVVLDLERLGGPQLMGALHRQVGARGDVLSFEYAKTWLEQAGAFEIDPDLSLASGRHYPSQNQESFGIFVDSAPDRWGRTLMQRRATHRARKDGRTPPILRTWDFLLGVHDTTRLGALRFRRNKDAPYLDDDRTLAAPPLARVGELAAISLKLEREDAEDQPEYERWLSQLVAPGSSLGGARPKAAVVDEKGRLSIAKFPSGRDAHDVGAWEMLVHRLAAKAGISVPEASIERFGDRGSTFVCRRFDRTSTGGRKMFVSAMTLLQRKDGAPGGSYLDLIELLQETGVQPRADAKQLFRRVAFNVSISNTDDHLRNHGFFIEPQGVVLAPAFDMNPSPGTHELTLAIDEHDASCELELVSGSAELYGLASQEAEMIIDEVQTAVATWRKEAKALGISKGEQDRLAPAFRVRA